MQHKPERGASKSTTLERPESSAAQDDVAASLERALASTPEDPRSWLDADIKTCRIYILIAAFLCGTNFPAVKLLQESLDPAALLSARFLLASVAMTPLLRGATKEAVFEGLETGAWLALGYITQAIALQTAQAGTTAFLCSLTTVVCPVIEKLTGSTVSKQAWGAALLAVVGAGILELGGGAQPGSGPQRSRHHDYSAQILTSENAANANPAPRWRSISSQSFPAPRMPCTRSLMLQSPSPTPTPTPG